MWILQKYISKMGRVVWTSLARFFCQHCDWSLEIPWDIPWDLLRSLEISWEPLRSLEISWDPFRSHVDDVGNVDKVDKFDNVDIVDNIENIDTVYSVGSTLWRYWNSLRIIAGNGWQKSQKHWLLNQSILNMVLRDASESNKQSRLDFHHETEL